MRRLCFALTISAALALSPACSDTPASEDGAPPKGDAGDAGVPPDTLAPDSPGPMANVYKVSPTVDKKKTSKVKLTNITDATGKLIGKWTNVYNCMPDDKGKQVTINIGIGPISGIICTLKRTALPGKDGSYLQIKPPAKDIVGNDAFAEIMMYHHVNSFHDHLVSSFGLKHLNKSLQSVVNLQGKVFGSWMGLPNAMFMPKESQQLLKQWGIDMFKDEDVIAFGFNNIMPTMGQVNFAYDASVIYHEYVHYSIGKALWMPAKDKYGLDPTPKGLNEALADYFPSSYLNNPMLGAYALGSSARDLTRDLRCPGHIVGEEHRDGEVASGALWAARKLLTAKVADKAYWNAIITFQPTTNFDTAAKAFLDELKKANVPAATLDTVKKLWETRGFLGCVRLVTHKDYSGSATLGPGYGGSSTSPSDFASGVPGYMQYKLEIKDTTKEITIEYVPMSGGMLGGGGALGDASVALKSGDKPILWDYTTGKAKNDALMTLKGAQVKDTNGNPTGYKLVLSGDCVKKGYVVYQFINHGTAGGGMTKVKIPQSATKTNTTDNFTGCTTTK